MNIRLSHKLLLLLPLFLNAESIEEKLSTSTYSRDVVSATSSLRHTNELLFEKKRSLRAFQDRAQELYLKNASIEEFSSLYNEKKAIKNEIVAIEKKWIEENKENQQFEDEGYGLFDQEETTVSLLVTEYGASDFVYIVPSDVASQKVNIHSALAIPRGSWDSLIEIILGEVGIGVEIVNQYAKRLYLYKSDAAKASIVTSNRTSLDMLEPLDRVVFVVNANPKHQKAAFHFLERFRDPKKTFIHAVNGKIVIASTKDEVSKLLRLYDGVWNKAETLISKVVPLEKLTPEEMVKVVQTYFDIPKGSSERFSPLRGGSDISVFPIGTKPALCIVGNESDVKRAVDLIISTEKQIESPSDMTIYWYSLKHSDPSDVSDVLEKVYSSLLNTSIHRKKDDGTDIQQNITILPEERKNSNGTGDTASDVVKRSSIENEELETKHFIPYNKTGSLMMVVRKDVLPKIKELLKKIDVPKKMVEVQVLLCERSASSQTNSGINVLKLGSNASGTKTLGGAFSGLNSTGLRGLFEFFISRPASSRGTPAFDVTYNFLLSQENVSANSAPVVTTINQVPAQISFVEEISINNGAAPLETNSNVTFEKSFTRAQYGINIVVTPTVHSPDPDDTDKKTFITLETDVQFDTPQSSSDDRPRVNRRHVVNQVRVADGQTIILGGLKKKDSSDLREKIPFLGEIPGIAKIFGSSAVRDSTTELFIFITPKVVNDESKDLEELLHAEFKKRPGDIPEHVERLQNARFRRRHMLLSQSFSSIFG